MSNRFVDNVTPLDAATLNGLEEDLLVSIEKEAVCPFGVLAAELLKVNRHCG